MATRTKDFNVTRDPSVISKQLVYTDSNENGSLNIPADYFGSKEDLDSKFVTFYYNLGDDDYPDSTYEEVQRQYTQKQKGLRLKTFVAAESVFLYGVKLWNGSKITFSEVIHGELIEATIDYYTNKWELTRRNVAFKSELDAEATARENADNELDGKIEAEKTARENGDSNLLGKVNDINAVIPEGTSESNKLVNNGELDDVAEGIGERIDGVVLRLGTKESARAKADTELDGKISAEASARANADSELLTMVNTKANAVHSHEISDVNGLQNFMDDALGQIVSEANQRRAKDLEIEGVLNTKANSTYVDTALNGKADKSTTYTKTEVDNKVSPKADKTYVDEMLGNVEALLAAI